MYNFLTVIERRDYVILKNMYKDYRAGNVKLSTRESSREIPLVITDTFQSESFKKSVKFRGGCIWNQLPRNLKIKELGYDSFKTFVKSWIKQKRFKMIVTI